jgi:hypothetical protein
VTALWSTSSTSTASGSTHPSNAFGCRFDAAQPPRSGRM